MRTLLKILLLTLAMTVMRSAPAQAPTAGARLVVLCYHDIAPNAQALGDPYAVDAQNLAQQLAWLRDHGFHFVSVDQVLASRRGGAPLPDKPVLLSFDDGYRSVYTTVFPLLKAFHAPAVVALVGAWLAPRDDQEVRYGDLMVPRSRFVTWDQVRDMQASGLIEIANHSYDLHRGIVVNPQGNSEPALTSRAYAGGDYESRPAYLERVRADLARNSALIRQNTGRAPRVMVWPYGSYNGDTVDIAGQLGMPVTLTLDEGVNLPSTPLSALRRVLLDARTDLADLASQLRDLETWPDGIRPVPQRIMQVDLDYIYDPDPQQQEANLGRLIERVKAMGVSTVYLQAFADPDGDGVASALYFPNRHLPMRADLFNRAAWQLQTRAGVKVYAWMPLLAFRLPASDPAAGHVVLSDSADGRAPAVRGYLRLSPYSSVARQTIREIYQDLARGAHFSGLLFHDDATLSDYEDAGPDALAAYRADGPGATPAAMRADPALLARWTAAKVRLLDDFSMELAAEVRRYQPGLKTARNYYAEPVLDPAAETWFAQSFASGLKHYDQVAVMAMPYMEQASDPDAWLARLFARVAAVPGALDKTVFELQTVDWRRNDRPIPTGQLAATVRMLQGLGARHLGYYPDDLFHDQPRLATFRRVFSLTVQPQP